MLVLLAVCNKQFLLKAEAQTFGPMEQEPMFLSRHVFPGCFWESFPTKCGVLGILAEAT